MPALVLNRKVYELSTTRRDHEQPTPFRSLPVPVAFWMLRMAIRLLGLVSPALAGRWVYRLWFQPLRFPEPPQEQEWRRTAQPLTVVHRGQRLAVDSWGAGPTVLMVHGWNGRGVQLGCVASCVWNISPGWGGWAMMSQITPELGCSNEWLGLPLKVSGLGRGVPIVITSVRKMDRRLCQFFVRRVVQAGDIDSVEFAT